jgi:hypothetical protein
MAGPLRIQEVAPDSAVAVLQVREVSDLVATLRGHGVLIDEDEADWDAYIGSVADELPSGFSVVLDGVLQETGALDLISSMSIGVATWIDDGDRGKSLTVAGWVDFGVQAEPITTAWDAAWEEIRKRPSAVTESVLGRDVDRLQSQADAESPADPMPKDLWAVRAEGRAYISNTRAGMERLLDAADGTTFDDALGDSESWSAVRGMVGPHDALLFALFTERAFEAGGLFDPMGLTHMLQASTDAFIGPIRAIAVAGGTGGSDTMVEASAALWMPEGLGGLLRLLAGDTQIGGVPKWLGPDAISVTRLNVRFKRIPDWLRQVVASNPMLMGVGQMLDQIEPAMRAILDPLDREMLMIGTLTHPISQESLRDLQVIACSNPVGLSDALTATAAESGMEPREFQGHQIWSTELDGLGPLPMPGMPAGRVSLAVAADSLLVGDDAAVEAALRSIGDHGRDGPAWAGRVLDQFPDEAVAAWGGWNLPESLIAAAEVSRLRMRAWEAELKADDPELWEEIKGELAEEADSESTERAAKFAEALGPLGWWATSADDGFRLRLFVLPSEAAASR